jgi:hypothetical protein
LWEFHICLQCVHWKNSTPPLYSHSFSPSSPSVKQCYAAFICIYAVYFHLIHPQYLFISPSALPVTPLQDSLPCICKIIIILGLGPQMSENMWCLAFWVWLILLSIMKSSSIHFSANDIISFSLWLSNIPWCVYVYVYIYIYVYIYVYIYMYMYHIFFIHSSIVGPPQMILQFDYYEESCN